VAFARLKKAWFGLSFLSFFCQTKRTEDGAYRDTMNGSLIVEVVRGRGTTWLTVGAAAASLWLRLREGAASGSIPAVASSSCGGRIDLFVRELFQAKRDVLAVAASYSSIFVVARVNRTSLTP
jgi:xanthine/CO dehydrogenase XdhC/CoxF family maturation factor